MNYSTIGNINLDQQMLLQMLNDENRSLDLINYEDESDAVVVRFNQAAAAAKNTIDSYLANYALPFASVPVIIQEISNDLTIYNIYKRRAPENIPDSIIVIYKDCK